MMTIAMNMTIWTRMDEDGHGDEHEDGDDHMGENDDDGEDEEDINDKYNINFSITSRIKDIHAKNVNIK